MQESENKKFKDIQLLPGAGVFLFIVVYVNIRHNHDLNAVDWLVILAGIIFFVFAFIKHRRDKI
jgi:hypothetical protein